MTQFNGVVYYRVAEHEHTVLSDACVVGAGAFCAGDWTYVNWDIDLPKASKLHINYKEILAVLAGVNRWSHSWTNSNVTIVTDSTVAKAIINRGTCRNPFVMNKLRELFWLSVKYNFKIHAVHLPGVLNCIPDSISRLHEPGQLLHLFSLLASWHHGYFSFNLADNMSNATLQRMTVEYLGSQSMQSSKVK